jgi:hypothetical protein
MDEKHIFGSYVIIWDTDDNEKVKIGIGICRNLSDVLIYEPCGMENCIVVLIEAMNEDCEQQKLLYLVSSVRYYESAMGVKVF